MIDLIFENTALVNIVRGACAENNMEVSICEDLLIDNEINGDRVLILKVDAFYNTRDFARPPKSIDCLIILNHLDSNFSLHLIELKDVNRPRAIKPSAIYAKFKNTINMFMKTDFGDVFLSDTFNILELELLLVTDPFNASSMTEDEYRKKIKGTALDAYQSFKPLKFKNFIKQIKHSPPPIEICT